MALGLLALICILSRLRSRLGRWRAAMVAGALALSLAGALYIFPQMEKARPPVPIEQLPSSDPLRIDYDRWHTLSERLFGLAIVLGAGAIILGPLGSEET